MSGSLETEAYVVPSAGAALELRKVVLPPLEAGHVEVEMSHCGLCHTEIHMQDNDWGATDFPVVLGHEGVGVVKNVGDNCKSLKVGDMVGVGWIRDSCGSCGSCHRGMDNTCSNGFTALFLGKSAGAKQAYNEWGGCFSKVVRISERFAFKVPNSIPPTLAAPLMCAGITMFEPVFNHVKPGMRVGIGSLGGLGTLGVKFAKLFGAHVTVISRNSSKKDQAKGCGAGGFIDLSDAEGLKRAAGTLDVIIDTCPVKNDLKQMLGFLSPNGKYVRCGIPPAAQAGLELTWMDLIFQQKSVCGTIVSGSANTNLMLKMVADNLGYMMEGGGDWAKVSVMPFEKINEAFECVKSGSSTSFRIVLQW